MNQYVTRAELSETLTQAIRSLSEVIEQKIGCIGDELKRSDTDARDTETRLRLVEQGLTVLQANAVSQGRFWGVLSGVGGSVATAIIIKFLIHTP